MTKEFRNPNSEIRRKRTASRPRLAAATIESWRSTHTRLISKEIPST